MAGKHIKQSLSSRVFDIFNVSVLILVCISILYPFIYVFSASVSDPMLVMQNRIVLLPKGVTLDTYRLIFEKMNIGLGFRNSIFYTFTGTVLSLFLTSLTAYSLSRKELIFRKVFMKLIVFTMYFSGGMIPTFLVIKYLGMYDTFLAMVVPGAISTINLLILRTFYMQIPESLVESARIDGSSELRTLFSIIMPLSLPSLATIGLFYAVGQWNSFLPALLYLNSERLYPLQLMIRNISILGNASDLLDIGQMILFQNLKYAVIFVTALPMILLYPFVQQFFVKGVMLGSIKE